jgi:hypothetical protein
MCNVTLLEYKVYNSSDTLIYDYLSTVGPQLWAYGEDINVTMDKNSIDEGSFTPGDFRINPYTVSESRYEPGTGHSESRRTYPNGNYELKIAEGCWGGVAFPESSFEFNLDSYDRQKDIALQKAMAKVGASLLSGGEELGELRETLSMIQSPMDSLKRFLYKDNKRNARLLAAIRKHVANPGKFLKEFGKTVADCWLEARYGWRPAIYLLRDAIELAEEAALKLDTAAIKRARSNREFSDSITDTSSYSLGFTFQKSLTCNLEGEVRAVVYYRELLPRTWQDKYGLSYQFTPELLFELTRLSFVLDWIWSIGPWLGSFRVKPGISILGNTVSIKTKVRGHASLKATRVPSFTHEHYSLPTKYEQNRYQREVNRDLSSTPLFLGNTNLDLYKILDSIALSYGAILKALK